MSTNTFGNGLGLDKYSSEDFFNMLLRYGLFAGAIFQLFCIGASILLPPTCEESICAEANEECKVHGETANNIRQQQRLHKVRKQEKKKRR
ncbi:protein anon-73B1 [Rhagoletis pomonella]|uniref:protein anon-73B1 n=1 Tax=Rhagoletis pomonella TaxID=28610 RepID=UPI00177D6F8A|nr:protein anon-73B1 [Rhagoletis pomonella]